ncbi:S-adenosyl-L-methionine-dependent methyltransferase [Echria macrotheca]|uniref:S-adenosyl-L-methionine-dependent methyltransferase n=1 Tax=Echria macrotheca TaxID=438768 RepID=A0AAJ0BA60_9PEZI|nr:S-adenosyl-L-methionine-dependent methyltransferase [Echria macrotheca]
MSQGSSPTRETSRTDNDGNDADDDNDSALGSDQYSTASITSSTYHYRQLGGRSYPNFRDVDHWEPVDEKQQESFDIRHHIYLMQNNQKLFNAPVQPRCVLDVGTGTGIWALDVADTFPWAEVIGIDLAPIQPPWVPPNCRFEVDDANMNWTFGDGRFNLVHIRDLVGSIRDDEKLYAHAFCSLEPGGWIEHTESFMIIFSDNNSIPEDCVYHDWNRLFDEAGEKTGKSFHLAERIESSMKTAGFRVLGSRKKKVPIGTWPKDPTLNEVGLWNQHRWMEGLDGYGRWLLKYVWSLSDVDIELFFTRTRKALRDKRIHAYELYTTVWAQKPGPGGQ